MKFSVAMCTYNGEAFLQEQLDSIAAQTRLPDELIICDDGSVDQTIRIVTEFAAQSRFPVHLSINQDRLGSSKNFEKAISLATGELIALVDQDDVWETRKLELLETVFADRPAVGLVFTNAELVDEKLKPVDGTVWQAVGFDTGRKKLVSAGRTLDVLLGNNMITGATMAFRAEFKNIVLPIPGDGCLYHDGWIALIISALAEIRFIDQPLIKYRQHAAQQMGAPKTTTTQSIIKAERTDRNHYLVQAQTFQLALDRLKANDGRALNPGALSTITNKIVHLRARARMPEQRLSRLPLVVKEIVNLHYHQYSHGLFSAAKDLFV